jgi:NADH-ubiquinone oxidoreductase chain 5
MYLSILVLPLLGSFVSGFMGRKIGVTGAHIITCTCLILSSILASIAFYEVGFCGSPVSINLTSWIDSEFMSISWEFLFDQLTVSMLIPVLYISSLIHIFSTDYMAEDPHNQRFFSYLSLFTFFMLVLVSGANFFVMFIGWEGIGVVSYLLINFWFTRIQANKAAILAFTMNRVGDMGLSIGFFAIFALFGSLDFSTVFSLVPLMNETGITIIGLLLLMGAMAKSAQIPLHSWLPGSMEGLKVLNFIFLFIFLYYYFYNSLVSFNFIKTMDYNINYLSILPNLLLILFLIQHYILLLVIC